jgi:hypothetical protein
MGQPVMFTVLQIVLRRVLLAGMTAASLMAPIAQAQLSPELLLMLGKV